MNKVLFEINNLYCFYKGSKIPVLDINDFKIKSGERVFIIGQSGVGKSTILESLGLMNNTIKNDNTHLNQKNSRAKFNFKAESFLNIWDTGEENLRKLRNENFSFIFQSNNLFQSMSMYQNIISGALISKYKNVLQIKKEASKIVSELLSDLNLNNGQDYPDITKMSGGQRQRVAFARAIITHKDILFGDKPKDILFADEPTGNLDWYNAEKVMRYLDKQLGEDKTAIIVTHDIEIALKFATKIIFIDKVVQNHNGEKISSGKINKESIYIKQEKSNKWEHNKIIKENSVVKKELKDKFLPKEKVENEI